MMNPFQLPCLPRLMKIVSLGILSNQEGQLNIRTLLEEFRMLHFQQAFAGGRSPDFHAREIRVHGNHCKQTRIVKYLHRSNHSTGTDHHCPSSKYQQLLSSSRSLSDDILGGAGAAERFDSLYPYILYFERICHNGLFNSFNL